jgi:hypothetical protein
LFSRKKIIPVVLLLAAGILVIACANPIAPTGGPKDVTPPKVLTCAPPNQSVHFTDNSIHILFDEFINLNNPGDKIIISPPLTIKPDYKLRGKKLIINLLDTLRSNTTYTFYFGDAVTDLNENNPLGNFQYICSTGSYLDSLIMSGSILNAFDLTPEKGVWVMLYKTPDDSLPYKELPFYATKTDQDGHFLFTNLREHRYKLFSLGDVNGNYLYDPYTEPIAFADSLLTPWPKQPVDLDDTVQPVAEPSLVFYMFQEIDTIQRLTEAKYVGEGMMQLVFRFPAGSVVLQPLDSFLPESRLLHEMNRSHDTMLVWVRPPVPDTLKLAVCVGDTVLDTVKMVQPQLSIRKRTIIKEQEQQKLSVTTNLSGGRQLDYFRPFVLKSTYPLVSYRLDGTVIIEDMDTLHPEIQVDDTIGRYITILHQWKEDYPYRLIIPDSSFIDILGHTNDSLQISFKTTSSSDYGSLKIDIRLTTGDIPYIIQLLNEKDQVRGETYITASATINFDKLRPGKYKLKAIQDLNHNRRWDTGIYLRMAQPEKVIFFNKSFDLHANWIDEETWRI